MQMSKEHHRIIVGLHFTLPATKSFVVKFPSFRFWSVVINPKKTRIIWGIMVIVLMLGTHLDTVGLAIDVGDSSSEMYLLGLDFYLGRRQGDESGKPDNFTEAFRWFTKAAEAGNTQAFRRLGECFQRGYGTAIDLQNAEKNYRKAAEAGDPDAQFRLGWFYIDEQKKYDEGRLWLQHAADQQHPMGLLCLGLCNEKGYGIAYDPQKAEQLFEKAIPMLQNSAEQGDVEAMCQLAWCYALGDGVSADETKAFQWWQKAAEQGFSIAQNQIATYYWQGCVVTQDFETCFRWFTLSADQGYPPAMFNLGLCYFKGMGCSPDFAKAIQYFQRAAERKDINAQFALGTCYAYGECGVAKDTAKAIEWWQKAANLGDAEAWYNIGVCLAFEETQQDREESFRYFQRASELGVPEADVILGNYYLRGTGVQQDCEKAVQYFQKAADHGNDGGMLGLAYCQLHGLGMTQDTVKAIEWIRKVAEKENDEAQFLLGVVYADGDGVTQDLGEAIQWFQKSVAQGNHDAQGALKAVKECLKDKERLEEIRKIPLPLPE